MRVENRCRRCFNEFNELVPVTSGSEVVAARIDEIQGQSVVRMES